MDTPEHMETPSMVSGTADSAESVDEVPWQQQLMDSEWLLAGAAVLFFFVSYVGWGLVDILTVPQG